MLVSELNMEILVVSANGAKLRVDENFRFVFTRRITPNGTRNVANLIGNNEEKWQILSALIRDRSRLRCTTLFVTHEPCILKKRRKLIFEKIFCIKNYCVVTADDHEATDRKFLLCSTCEKYNKNLYNSFMVRGYCRGYVVIFNIKFSPCRTSTGVSILNSLN